jgi:exonuclease III
MMKRKNYFSKAVLALLAAIGLVSVSFASVSGKKRGQELRLLYWNIQNGMWSGQGDNYDTFVNWVKSKNPDVCVWCEGQTIFKTGTADYMNAKDRYLVDNWGELAKRYGHDYWYVGAHRDSYPQVITSKYPIKNVKRIFGNDADTIVSHGAGWATIEVAGKTINIVTLHTWPMGFAMGCTNVDSSTAEFGGDKYRRREIEYILKETIANDPKGKQMWMMMGDFNSASRVDAEKNQYPADDPRFLVHDYIRNSSPYIDVIKEQHPTEFKPTTGWNNRIDFVYCTKPLYKSITYADVITDDYTKPVRDPKKLSNFWHPSDHKPIIVDFLIK